MIKKHRPQRGKNFGALYRIGALYRKGVAIENQLAKPGKSKSAERRRAADRSVVHSAPPGQTFLVGTTEYLVQPNGSFRRLGPK